MPLLHLFTRTSISGIPLLRFVCNTLFLPLLYAVLLLVSAKILLRLVCGRDGAAFLTLAALHLILKTGQSLWNGTFSLLTRGSFLLQALTESAVFGLYILIRRLFSRKTEAVTVS